MNSGGGITDLPSAIVVIFSATVEDASTSNKDSTRTNITKDRIPLFLNEELIMRDIIKVKHERKNLHIHSNAY